MSEKDLTGDISSEEEDFLGFEADDETFPGLSDKENGVRETSCSRRRKRSSTETIPASKSTKRTFRDAACWRIPSKVDLGNTTQFEGNSSGEMFGGKDETISTGYDGSVDKFCIFADNVRNIIYFRFQRKPCCYDSVRRRCFRGAGSQCIRREQSRSKR